eukprot:scaffold5707_cov112-Cylindrotheca_fusiformis.AAC.8
MGLYAMPLIRVECDDDDGDECLENGSEGRKKRKRKLTEGDRDQKEAPRKRKGAGSRKKLEQSRTGPVNTHTDGFLLSWRRAYSVAFLLNSGQHFSDMKRTHLFPISFLNGRAGKKTV